MRKYYFKVKQNNKKKSHELIGFIIIIIGVLLLYGLLWPHYAGVIGLWINKRLSFMLGMGKLFLPVAFFIMGATLIIKRKVSFGKRLAGMGVIVWMGATFFSLVTGNAPHKNLGGLLGKYSEQILVQALGRIGAFLILVVVFMLILHWTTQFSIAQFYKAVYAKILEDWKSWQRARREEKRKKIAPPIIKPVIKPIIEQDAPLQPRIVKPPAADSTADGTTPKNADKKKMVPLKHKRVPSAMQSDVERKEIPVWTLPSIELLHENKVKDELHKEDELVSRAAQLESALSSFNIQAKVTDINPGPIITRYDLKLAPGVKVGSIISLSNDLSLTMKSSSIRIIAPIPGKAAVGIEIPNSNTVLVGLREIIASEQFKAICSDLPIGLGRTTDGRVYCTDLAPMPHLLIAGATGSGKSVCIHSIIISILYRSTPNDVKFVLIDPKRLELPVYNGLPHLYDPNEDAEDVEVITNSKRAAKTLDQLTKVMENRYEKFARVSARNIEGYNRLMVHKGEPKEYYIVVIIDELADLMLVASRDVEESIQRLAQMARAVGIHLILTTQRPSVDVITGVIKANLSARIACQVLSKIDSRVILDMGGAEDLLGRGDMLYLPSGEPRPMRVQGSLVNEKEVESVVAHYIRQGKPAYVNETVRKSSFTSPFEDEESFQELIVALKLVQERRRVSQDLLKAHFGSSATATNILSLLEIKNFIRKPEGSNRWEIFFDQVDSFLEEHEEPVKNLSET